MLSRTFFQIAYPFEHSTKEKIQSVGFASLFLSLLLILLQPYGFMFLSRLQYLLGYLCIGLVTFNINYFGLPYFFPNFFEDQSWSISKAFLFFLYNFFQLGIWVHIFNTLVMRNDPTVMTSGIELGITVIKIMALGAVSSCFLILVRYNWVSRQNLQASQDLNQQLKAQISLEKEAEHQQEQIPLFLENKPVEISRSKLLYIRSEGNYLAFHFEPGFSKSPLLVRGRIKQLEEVLSRYPEFFRCHRSFIVNLNHVSSTRGNSQGLSIQLRHSTDRLPVARPKIKALRLNMEKQLEKNKPFIT
ncbi:MAG: LytTR family DNA-binding domain-containing protein [Saprospiraceae bacterium]|nr:LytTR family DNA-binding domain-containing protein [Saprospiraceae bacterium]